MATNRNRNAAKTASPTRDTADVKRADTKSEDNEQTWVVGHDGKRVKSEDYAKSDEFRGIVKDS